MQLVINSNNMEVIDTMKEGGRSAGTTAAVFDDCFYSACDFTISRFEHYNREANKVAHKLARMTKFSLIFYWLEGPLNEIVSILINNVMVISNE
ncbi:hypothetical protein CFC21_001062 [Triticum aestivum]|uniref:RNase H type-1 domain-containing protein n=1 Tax=Triticum aestivum TaxID=4565 RepID=A0A3B5XVV6_WHEAT|nr:hypothetical protein CFC21_001062 [Triticum aestivum]